MTDTTRAHQVNEELNLHHQLIEGLNTSIKSAERNNYAIDQRLDELMAIVAGLAEEVRQLANPCNSTPQSARNLGNQAPETMLTRKEGNTLTKLELPTFDGNREWTEEFTEAVENDYNMFDKMADATKVSELKLLGKLTEPIQTEVSLIPFTARDFSSHSLFHDEGNGYIASKISGLKIGLQMFDEMPEPISIVQNRGTVVHGDLVPSRIRLLKILGYGEVAPELHLLKIKILLNARHMFDEMPIRFSADHSEEVDGMFLFDPGGSSLLYNRYYSFELPECKQHLDIFGGTKAGNVSAFDHVVPISRVKADEHLKIGSTLSKGLEIVLEKGSREVTNLKAFNSPHVYGGKWIIVNLESVGINRAVGWLMCGWFWGIKQLCITIYCLIPHVHIATEFILERFVNWCLDVKVLDRLKGCKISIVASKGLYKPILIFVSTKAVNEVPQKVGQNIEQPSSSIENGIQLALILIKCTEDIQQEDEAVVNNSVLELNHLSPWSWKIGGSFMNLKGFLIGNVVINDATDQQVLIDYACSHAIIPNDPCCDIITQSDFKSNQRNIGCNMVVKGFLEAYSDIDIYNIYAPACPSSFYTSTVPFAKQNDFFNFTRKWGLWMSYDSFHFHELIVADGLVIDVIVEVTVLANFIWDPGLYAIFVCILEDKDVLKRKGIGIRLALTQDEELNEIRYKEEFYIPTIVVPIKNASDYSTASHGIDNIFYNVWTYDDYLKLHLGLLFVWSYICQADLVKDKKKWLNYAIVEADIITSSGSELEFGISLIPYILPYDCFKDIDVSKDIVDAFKVNGATMDVSFGDHGIVWAFHLVPIGLREVSFQSFVWDPGLDGVFRFSTLRTRCLFRGGICHDSTFYYNFNCISELCIGGL